MTIAKKVLLAIADEFYTKAQATLRAPGDTEAKVDTYLDAADALMDVLDMWNEEGE